MAAVGIARKVRGAEAAQPARSRVGATTLFEGVDVLEWYGEGRTFATLKEQQKKAAAEEADGSASALSVDQ